MPPVSQLPHISPFTLRFFRYIARSYFRKHFRAVQIQNAERLASQAGPLIVYGNHTSWWDPMIGVLLAHVLLPHRKHYAPIDGDQLKRYPILRRIGIFPIQMHGKRSAADFLATAEAILASGGVLWITPQGRFADPRERPLDFKPGMALLALRFPQATLLPLAVEYPFWNERMPEALALFGEPVRIDSALSPQEATAQLEAALEVAMASLQHAAIARDPAQFQTLLHGTRGTGGFYGFRQRLSAWRSGAKFSPDHTPRENKSEGDEAKL